MLRGVEVLSGAQAEEEHAAERQEDRGAQYKAENVLTCDGKRSGGWAVLWRRSIQNPDVNADAAPFSQKDTDSS
jgi:hypothetical protein